MAINIAGAMIKSTDYDIRNLFIWVDLSRFIVKILSVTGKTLGLANVKALTQFIAHLKPTK